MNTTIRNVNDKVFHELKIEATKEGITIGQGKMKIEYSPGYDIMNIKFKGEYYDGWRSGVYKNLSGRV